MKVIEITAQLEALGAASYKQILLNHGAREPVFGVKIEELKKIQKRVKKDHQLALELFDTGCYDAQYLAGLMADDARMTPDDLRRWQGVANCNAIRGSSVAWVAAESGHGRELALEWIESDDADAAQTGWCTLTSLVGITEDALLDVGELGRLLQRVAETIHQQPDCVRGAMNSFVIALGSYVPALSDAAIRAGERIGRVSVDVGNTACKIPYAPDYIRKALNRGVKKRKTAKC